MFKLLISGMLIGLFSVITVNAESAWTYDNGLYYTTLTVTDTVLDTTAAIDVKRFVRHSMEYQSASVDTEIVFVFEGSNELNPTAASSEWYNINSTGAKITNTTDSTDALISSAFIRWLRVRAVSEKETTDASATINLNYQGGN